MSSKALPPTPAIVVREVTVAGRTLAPGTRVLASLWGGAVRVLWHGAEVVVPPGTVRRVVTIEKEAA